MRVLHRAILDVELVNDNQGAVHWAKKARRRRDIEFRLRHTGHVRTPFEHSVEVVVSRILGPRQRLWDEDSLGRGNAKQVIDSLVALGWFHDDKPEWIRRVDYCQERDRRDIGPATEVTVYE